jgi:RNA polymerase sigma-54 factor
MVLPMKMNFNLNLVQTQKLIMTPELKQAIEILQYNAIELNEFINEELLNNPILEKLPQETEEEVYSEKQEVEFEYDLDKTGGKEVDWEEMVNYFDEGRPMGSTPYNPDSEINYDNFVADEETLKDYLDMQLKFSKLDEDVVKICEYIVENIDDNGYLQMKNEEAMLIFNKSNDEIERLVKLIQTFDPPGVGARNIKECLLIQMYQQGYEESLEE